MPRAQIQEQALDNGGAILFKEVRGRQVQVGYKTPSGVECTVQGLRVVNLADPTKRMTVASFHYPLPYLRKWVQTMLGADQVAGKPTWLSREFSANCTRPIELQMPVSALKDLVAAGRATWPAEFFGGVEMDAFDADAETAWKQGIEQ